MVSFKILTEVWTMEIYCVLTYQYSVTVNDSVEPVSNGEDGTLLKLVPDSLLDEAVSSKGAGNTTPQHKKTLPIDPWAGILLNTERWLISSKVCAVVGITNKG